MRPKSAFDRLDHAAIESASRDTSVVDRQRPAAGSDDLASPRLASRRHCAPQSPESRRIGANAFAKTLPMPCPAPVMMATRSFSEAKSVCFVTACECIHASSLRCLR